MAKIHDLFIVELAEVIKGYGNEPDDEDPFRLAEFYRFYELPNIAVSRENFEKMRPVEPQRNTGTWLPADTHGWEHQCSECGFSLTFGGDPKTIGYDFCPRCGAQMNGGNSND